MCVTKGINISYVHPTAQKKDLLEFFTELDTIPIKNRSNTQHVSSGTAGSEVTTVTVRLRKA